MTALDDGIRLMKFVTVFECGGTERQFTNLGLALHDRGMDLRFGCLRRQGRLLAPIEARRIPTREYPMRSFYSARFVQRQMALARDLVRERVNVVHAYNLYGNVFAVPAARLAGVPVVIAAIRDCGVYLTPWKRRVQRAACRMADLVLVNAQGVKDWLISEGYDAGRIAIIRNGIDVAPFDTPPAADARPLRDEFGIPQHAPVVSMIARLCPSKGFDDAIEAMALVCDRRPDARLLIVGEELRSENGVLVPDQRYRGRLEARTRALGIADRVIFAGYRADIPRILQQVDLSVQPSITEGLSNSVLEAMTAGVALVTTPVGGTPEVVVHDETGWLTPAGDPRALAASISMLLGDRDRRRRLGAAAARVIRDRFSVRRMVDATADLYRDLLDRKRGRSASAA